MTYSPLEHRQSMILACLFLWSILAYCAFSRFVVMGTEVDGDSMVPTLESGDRLLLERFAYKLADPSRGDIVAVKFPDEGDVLVKRVIAVSGELIAFRAGRVHVNGRQLDEPYLSRNTVTSPGGLSTNTYAVLPDCYFVLGDNRGRSSDSRSFGAVRKDWILGRVVGMKRSFLDVFGL